MLAKSLGAFAKIGWMVLVMVFVPGLADAQMWNVKIHDLEGFEDSTGTTQLFYRFYQLEAPDDDEYPRTHRNHVYNLNTATKEDSLFFRDGYYVVFNGPLWGTESETTVDYLFPNQTTDTYLHSAYYCVTDCSWGLSVQDSAIIGGYGYWPPRLIRDPVRSDRIFAAQDTGALVISQQNGNWSVDSVMTDSLDISFRLISIHTKQKNLAFGVSGDRLVRSTIGNSFKVVDTARVWSENTEFFFDRDSTVIYARDLRKGDHQSIRKSVLYRSNQSGQAGTWQRLERDTSFIAFETNPGQDKIYKSSENKVLVSSNKGDDFQILATFQQRVTGMYQPDNASSVLYVSTRSDIWKMEGGNKVESLKHVELSVEDARNTIPDKITLRPNYPNPFNPSTQIEFSLPQASDVQLTVYDVLGRRVATLINGKRQAGQHSVTFDASNLASGVYIYRLKGDGFSKSRKMLLLR